MTNTPGKKPLSALPPGYDTMTYVTPEVFKSHPTGDNPGNVSNAEYAKAQTPEWRRAAGV